MVGDGFRFSRRGDGLHGLYQPGCLNGEEYIGERPGDSMADAKLADPSPALRGMI